MITHSTDSIQLHKFCSSVTHNSNTTKTPANYDTANTRRHHQAPFMKMTKDISSIRFEGELYNFNARRKQRKHLTMRTESDDCSQLRRPENRQRQETNDAKPQKIQEEPAAANVTPNLASFFKMSGHANFLTKLLKISLRNILLIEKYFYKIIFTALSNIHSILALF